MTRISLNRPTALVTAALLAAGLVAGVATAQQAQTPDQTPDQSSRWMTQLMLMDTDKDGQITKAEADTYRAEQQKAMDANGDGTISMDEMKAGMARMMGVEPTGRVGQMGEMRFAKLDTNGDGALSADEMAADNRFTRIFKRIDQNGDGTLGKEELAQAQAWAQEHRGKKHGRMGDCGGRGFGKPGMDQPAGDQPAGDQPAEDQPGDGSNG